MYLHLQLWMKYEKKTVLLKHYYLRDTVLYNQNDSYRMATAPEVAAR